MATRPPRIVPSSAAITNAPSPSERAAPIGGAAVPMPSPLPRRSGRIAAAPIAVALAAPPPNETWQFRRRRKSTALPALISVAGSDREITCTIVDLSAGGARVHLPPASVGMLGGLQNLPDDLMLALRPDRLGVACKVRWRTAHSLGLSFKNEALPVNPLVSRSRHVMA